MCLEECPDGWNCLGLSGFGVDMVFLCVPKSKKLCFPCEADSQCAGGVCVELDEGNYCAYKCDPKSPCPASFSCQWIIKNEVSMEVCLPDSGSCECTSNTEGQLRPCTKENDFGACVGYEKCDPAVGWVDCNAPEPEGEACDGKDNDCDGLFDEEVPESMECENTVADIGTCTGMSVCNGPFGWVCNAAMPEPEACDFKDNNCDGEVDEEYKTDGKYAHHNHCGTCNVDCTGAIEHATAICDSAGGTAQCVVEECEEEYYKLNDFQCMPEGQTLCKPCLNDLGCEGGKCVTIFGGQYCTQSCASNPCPDTFECLSMEEISGKWCVPVSGSCDCSKDTAGATKPCSSANDFGTCYGFEVCDPEIGWVDCTAGLAEEEVCDGVDNDCNAVPDDGLPPSQPCEVVEPGVGTCEGQEVCLGGQGWVCDAPKPEPESCDFKDNDCNGQVDEDFIINGKYGTLHHCGTCNEDCEGSLPNGVAYCDVDIATPECKIQECFPGFFKLNEFQCILPPDVQCKECETDGDCYFDQCIPLDLGNYCLSACEEGQCGESYHCEEIQPFGDTCVPDTASCECSAENAGVKRSCSMANALGTCFGFETCDPDVGWTPCDASPPEPEMCDGIDNDCNGLIDDALPPTQPCEKSNEFGTCPGVSVCTGIAGWVCQAPEPSAEICDYQDNDCDGQVDEDFKQGEEKYHLDSHCGTCNNECADAIPHATGECDPTYLIPKCVVAQCDDDYFQVSPFQCVVPPDTTCQACEVDADCVGSLCVEIDEAMRCAAQCSGNAECGGETECIVHPGKGKLCQPTSGSCECNSFTEGTKRSCSTSNGIGTCFGFQTCSPQDGWSDCDALVPSIESCNGVDDDCNGMIDDGLPQAMPCDITNAWGKCSGVAVCMGTVGWICQAPEPSEDICDYIDNDCADGVDEDFKNAEGKYNAITNCGSCTISCEAGFPNAVAMCDDTKETPQCVVESCDDGYFKLNEFQCIPDTANLCEPCSTDDNCVLSGAKCVQLADGKFCSKHCEDGQDCPSGYTCEPYEGDKQCMPETNACTCDGSNPDLSKSCSATWPPNPVPGEPFVTCYGTEFCTADGWSDCELPVEVCDGQDNDCNGVNDDGFLVNGKYVGNTNCGQCGNNCTFLVYPNASGVCDGSKPVPDCIMECQADFHDVNANPADGCECQYAGAVDKPDGIDQNCDGVDGELDNAVFVAKNGADQSSGSIDQPMLTIQAAIDKAASTGKRDVYVATGVYSESVKLKQGVQVYGGYSSDFMQRNIVLYETVIMGKNYTQQLPGAINAVSLGGAAGSTVVDGFTIFGHNNNGAGGSSYTVYIKDSTQGLRFSNNHVVAGNGGVGQAGAAGSDGQDGIGGSAGQPAFYYSSKTCNVGKVKDGGDGGQRICSGTSVAGGKGGDSYCPADGNPHAGEYGNDGSGAGGGDGGQAGWDGRFLTDSCGLCTVPTNNNPMEGGDGYKGSSGANGPTGAGCSQGAGSVVNGFWQSYVGNNGGTGAPGSGGGGGGGGGGADVIVPWGCNDHIGGTGGGAGSGGCHGTGGTGGQGGGGSFGVFLYFSIPPSSVPSITDNFIEGGFGGAGGYGANGGTGGVGGTGATGGAPGSGSAWCANGGGTGGDGGTGGHGGGGGGGCGGVAYCVYAWGQGNNDLTSYKAPGNTCALGSPGGGGAGGPSIGNNGEQGDAGTSASTNF